MFGVCRGLQLLNVAFGGTLLQDISTQQPEALTHRDAGLYDRNFHAVEFVPGSRLAQLYPGLAARLSTACTTRASRTWRADFIVEARCPDDEHDRGGALAGPELRRRGAVAPGVPRPGRLAR